MILPEICKRVLLTLMILTAASTSARSAGWELVFSDEFNGDKLDRTKWATRYLYQNETMDHFNDENERYRDGHVVADGVLNLIAKKMPGSVSLYESAMIRSHRTFYYGYYEARVFLPNAKGVWPAFWLEADYDIDGRTWHPPEIDIFEYVINGVEDKANSLHSNVVGPFSAQQYTYVDRSFELKFQNMYGAEDLNQGWHTAGFVWAPDKISMFWDGKLIYTRNYQWLRSDGKLGPPAHVDLNFAVGGSKWAGRHGIDEAAFPQTFKIDYVRVCQFTDTDKGTRQCGLGQVTPDPKEFGYATTIRDLAKPAFLPVRATGPQQLNGGVLSLKAADPIKVEVPINVPEGYPSNRQLQVSIYDPTARSVVAIVDRKLQEGTDKRRADGAKVVELTLPAIQRIGNFVMDAKLTVETTDDKGARQELPSPVTCSTAVDQPVKARSCQLLTVQVR
jgi:beta-glucanase (GH16 family)